MSTLQAAECSLGDGMYTDWALHRWAGSSPLSGLPGLSREKNPLNTSAHLILYMITHSLLAFLTITSHLLTHHQTGLQRPSSPGDQRAPWRPPVPAANHVTARWPGCASACPPTEAPQSRGEGRSWWTNQKLSNTARYSEKKIPLWHKFFSF